MKVFTKNKPESVVTDYIQDTGRTWKIEARTDFFELNSISILAIHSPSHVSTASGKNYLQN